MKYNKYNLLLATISLFSFLLFAANQTVAGVAVIVSANNNTQSLSQAHVKSIFLGKTNKLPDGTTVVPVYQTETSETYKQFNSTVLEKNNKQLLNFWAKRVFTGKGVPPKALENDQAVISHVKTIPGGIGYIDSRSVDASVKVIYQAE